jgi:hypothetical protein
MLVTNTSITNSNTNIGIVKTRPRAHFSPFLYLYESLAVLIQKGKGNCICRDQKFYPVQAGEWLVTGQIMKIIEWGNVYQPFFISK